MKTAGKIEQVNTKKCGTIINDPAIAVPSINWKENKNGFYR